MKRLVKAILRLGDNDVECLGFLRVPDDIPNSDLELFIPASDIFFESMYDDCSSRVVDYDDLADVIEWVKGI